MTRWAESALLLAMLTGPAASANAVIQTALPQLLFPLPSPAPTPTAPAPMPPPINPGYAATPPNGLSPLLTQPGPVYALPQPPNSSYPPLQLPAPIDQQKVQSYRNDLRSQQWQMQWRGLSPSSERAREIQQQLNAPDPQ